MRNNLRFSLRTLLIVTTGFAVWLGVHLGHATTQRRAVKVIEEYGGSVYYDYQFTDSILNSSHLNPNCRSTIPTWALNAFGVDAFHSVIEVQVHDRFANGSFVPQPNDSDALFANIGQLRNVRTVTCFRSQICDEDLVHLKNLRKLKWLTMANAHLVTDVGVMHLQHLKKLEAVHLTNSEITDESMKVFAGFPNIRNLVLLYDGASNKALDSVGNAMQLEQLVIGSPAVNDNCSIDDEGLKHIKDLTNLTMLGIQSSRVRGPGFRHLEGMKKLRSMAIGSPPQPHADELMAKIPGLWIAPGNFR